MKLRRIDAMINCPIYKARSAEISAIIQKVRRSVRPIEKSIFEEDIEEAAAKLFSCESYDRLSNECRKCRSFASRKLQSVSEPTSAETIA
ncbi:MAG: hypothetical protein ACOCX8_01940 [Bacteroidota bacterium]